MKVNAVDLVPTMHEAYQRIRFDNVSYGVFIAGPSKTADIEQSLVIGAHDPKALTVIITNASVDFDNYPRSRAIASINSYAVSFSI
jgi:L-lactate dehydrogenase complex protein LldG